ncbi:hypothetical protein A4X06_0g5262 [Tilletia controversa]|uniref:DNA ligase ATP-dependent N-terminal domain-containing protein n=1 Tax=Tilletia controversa TaxID=13291 RepID=A0A8X7MQU0_9BASI|nr:hypothetical protein A4X06_0g5262 [Tilletia controversa]
MLPGESLPQPPILQPTGDSEFYPSQDTYESDEHFLDSSTKSRFKNTTDPRQRRARPRGIRLHKAIQSVTGKSNRFLKNFSFEAKKDIKILNKPGPITVAKLFTTLHPIARLSGAGSQFAKPSHVLKLLVAGRGKETRFLARTFIAPLGIQAVRTTMATSLAARVDTPHAPGASNPTDDGPKGSQFAKARGKAKASYTVVSKHDVPVSLPQPSSRVSRSARTSHIPINAKDRQNKR